MLRLAGVRINPANNGPHNPARFHGYLLKRIADGREIRVTLPPDAHLGAPIWSPDGRRFAFINYGRTSVELWVGDARTGSVQVTRGVRLNASLDAPCEWMPDSSSLLCLTVPAGRGAPPQANPIPTGPHIEESFGKAAPQPTFEDLLQNAFDEKVFDYYATAQLELVRVAPSQVGAKPGAADAQATPLGQPAVFRNVEAAPDGQHILVERVRHPYSYLVPYVDFPCNVEVWNRRGGVVYKVASLPLHETTPLGGVPLGPRDFAWQATAPATLVWVEALTKETRVRKLRPATACWVLMWPHSNRTPNPRNGSRPRSALPASSGASAPTWPWCWDYVRDQQRRRGYFFDPHQPAASLRRVWDLSVYERYQNPGRPVMRMLASGHAAMAQDGDDIFLAGEGASPQGNRPFLDRFNVQTLESTRVFHCDESSLESFAALLALDGSKFLTRHETPTDPPNYFLRTASGGYTAFTHFPNHVPQLAGIKKELVKYQRPDGVGLSMTLYLAPRLPARRTPAGSHVGLSL